MEFVIFGLVIAIIWLVKEVSDQKAINKEDK